MADPLRAGDPRKVGSYRLEGRLGGGGMGQVFLGRSPGGMTVAVKVVRSELADDADFRRRFAAEVEAARKVGGFYTAQVVDADTDADPPWMATAYIPGLSLNQAVTDHGPMPAESVAVLGAGLAEGLAAVHACGLVHRDLKPANVILAEDGPRVIDFGIARALDTTSHTVSRTVVGTPAFMSPEQARADTIGPPSDVFSLGCVVAFAATGRSPFGTGADHAVTYRIVHEKPDLTGIPDHLADLISACLDKDPDRRPEVPDILGRLAAPGPAPTRWLPDDITEVITQRRTAVSGPAPATPPPPSAPTKKEELALSEDELKPWEKIASSFPLVMRDGRKAAIMVDAAIKDAFGISVALVLLSVAVLLFSDIPYGYGFWDVLSFIAWEGRYLIAVVIASFLFANFFDMRDNFVVGTDGIRLVYSGWLLAKEKAFSLFWENLERISVAERDAGVRVVVWFRSGHHPSPTLLEKHDIQALGDGYLLATLPLPISLKRRTKKLAELRAALVRHAGDKYARA